MHRFSLGADACKERGEPMRPSVEPKKSSATRVDQIARVIALTLTCATIRRPVPPV